MGGGNGRDSAPSPPATRSGSRKESNPRSRSQSPQRLPRTNNDRDRGDNPASRPSLYNSRRDANINLPPSRLPSSDEDSNLITPRPINDEPSTMTELMQQVDVDTNVTFETIGGLEETVEAMKNIIMLPLMFPELFTKFDIPASRGVLFHGPPGTGKTMMARAICNAASQGDRKIAFFLRKGADCLSKWVGDTEQNIRALFEEARRRQPSIIFFDEIDGLAPARSSKEDQIYSSIVTTLLALMDGLDKRGSVVVIGATNRIDRIDPALRRPGRFDLDLLFTLPNKLARKTILKVRTKSWGPEFSDEVIYQLADDLQGWSGADINSLCSQSFYNAFKRKFPAFFTLMSQSLTQRDLRSLRITLDDVYLAMEKVLPSGVRLMNGCSPGRPVPPRERMLVEDNLLEARAVLYEILPIEFEISARTSAMDDNESPHANTLYPYIKNPRLLLAGLPGQGQSHYICPALLYELNAFPTHTLSFAIYESEGIGGINKVFDAATSSAPSIVHIPNIDTLWASVHAMTKDVLYQRISTLFGPVLILATSDVPVDELSRPLKELLSNNVVSMRPPTEQQLHEYFSRFIVVDVLLQDEEVKTRSSSKSTSRLVQLEPAVQKKLTVFMKDILHFTRDLPVHLLSEMRSHLAARILTFLIDNEDVPGLETLEELNRLLREFVQNMS